MFDEESGLDLPLSWPFEINVPVTMSSLVSSLTVSDGRSFLEPPLSYDGAITGMLGTTGC